MASLRPRRWPSRPVVLPAGLAVLGAALAWGGAFKVGPDEVAVTRAGGGAVARVYGPGWHWRLPLTERPLRLPHGPVPYAAELELPGAARPLVVGVSGRFGVETGREETWVSAAGWRPFLDGVVAVLRTGLDEEARALPADRIFGREAQERLRRRAESALAAAGAQVEQVAVHVPAERNAQAADAARAGVAALARPTGRKVLLVGWDGADWLIIRPLLRQGRLPNLQRLMARGASGELLAIKPLLSPLIWTTIATGKPATEHGVADFLVKDAQSGELVPIGSDARRVHALWTILPAFGLRTDVVGWWATWPAETTQGTVVTDRVAYQLFALNEDRSGYGKVYPPQAWDWVRGELVTADRIGHDEAGRFVDVDAQEYQRLWEGLPPERRQEERVNHLRKVLATTRSYHQVALALLEQQADLTLAYYEGTDTVGHLFARYLPPAMPGVKAGDVRRFGHALPEFYAWADQLLGELVAKAGPDTTVLLVSDHGFFTGEARPAADPSDFTAGAPQWHRLHGILVAAGPGIEAGEVHDATVLDVAPTVLSLLGLPVPRDMPGHALFDRREGARALASYELLPRAAAAAAPRTAGLDKERLRELAALGYVSADALKGAAAAAPTGSAPATAPGTEAFATEAYNLGRMHQDRGELEAARAQYRQAVDRLATFGLGWAALAQAAELQGNHGEAFDTLVQGFAHSPSMPLGAITGLVDLGDKAGRLDEAARTLDGLPVAYKGQSGYHAAWGLYYEKKGQPVEALRAFQRALQVDPLDELAIDRTVALLRKLGREKDAQEFLAEVVAAAAGSVQSLNQIAVVALRQGWGRQAEGIFRRVLKSDPGNPGVLANLAVSLGQQRRMKEASDVMREAVRRDPGEAQNHFNLGAMLAEQGRWPEALAAFEQARARGLRTTRVQIALAKMRFRLGDREGSRRDLQQALALDPSDSEARALLAQLE
jgi:tetratricopeptide (TPR) repeat protein